MNTISVNYTLVWQIKTATHYQFTKDGRCFNVKTGRELQKKYQSGAIGYNISGRFTPFKKLRENLEKIPILETPF